MIPPTDMTANASSGRRWSACLTAACLAGLLLVPTDASAADLEPGADGCSDPLASYSPAGQHGDVQAVAIVAQSFEQGVPGWAHVAWQATPDTTVTAVSVVSGGIATSLTGALSSGVADAVERIDFCGTTTPEGAAAGSAPAPAAPAGAGADPSGEAPQQGAASTGADPAGGDGEPVASDPAPQTDVRVSDGAPGDAGRAAREAGGATDGADGDRGDDDGPADAGEAPARDVGVDPGPGTSAATSLPDATRASPELEAVPTVDVILASDGTGAFGTSLAPTDPDPAAVPRGVAIGLTAGALVLLGTRRRDEEGAA